MAGKTVFEWCGLRCEALDNARIIDSAVGKRNGRFYAKLRVRQPDGKEYIFAGTGDTGRDAVVDIGNHIAATFQGDEDLPF